MSFESNQSSILLRREVKGTWRQRLENAFERYRATAEEYLKLLRNGAQCPRNELQRVMRAETEALEEHSRILRIFTDLVMDGKLREETDEAIGSAGAPPASSISVVDDDVSIRDSLKTQRAPPATRWRRSPRLNPS